MNTTDLDERMRQIQVSRIRRCIHWQRTRGEKPADAVIKGVIEKGVWSEWEYPDLLECLTQELGLSQDDAVNWTVDAIKQGYEDAGKYGVD